MATETVTMNEQDRAASLRDAETKAVALFEEIARDLIRPGITDKQLSDDIHRLGQERHNVRTHWHKRVVRSEANTLAPFQDNPPDRTLEPGDIIVVDLGPVFEAWEADFGRSYVVPGGPSPDSDATAADKKKLIDALEPMWYKIKGLYKKNPDVTGEELFRLAESAAQEEGWKWGAFLAGHIVGDFPHERIPKDKITNYIVPDNKQKLSSLDKKGNKLHWILEVHLRPQHEKYGAFFEQILTAD